MDEHEANYLRQCIRELEQANRRWKLAVLSLLVLLFLVLIPGGLAVVGLMSSQRLRATEARFEAERAAMEARMAQQRVEEARLAAQLAKQSQAHPEGEPAPGGLQGTKSPAPQQPAGKARPGSGERGPR